MKVLKWIGWGLFCIALIWCVIIILGVVALIAYAIFGMMWGMISGDFFHLLLVVDFLGDLIDDFFNTPLTAWKVIGLIILVSGFTSSCKCDDDDEIEEEEV